MNYSDFFNELRETCPDSFGFLRTISNAAYRWINGEEVLVDADSYSGIFELTWKYKDKYGVTVRVDHNSRVIAIIEIKENSWFVFPVTTGDENFDKYVASCGTPEIKNDATIKNEIKELYDWVFQAYRKIVQNH